MFHPHGTRAGSRCRLAVALGTIAAMAGGAAGFVALRPASSAGPQVEIRGEEYSPSTLSVAAGTTVTWLNHDDDVHTVTSSTDVFHSPGIETDETFTYTFTQPGTYEYFCKLHPLMTAQIVVR